MLNMAKSQNWPEVTLAAFYSHGLKYARSMGLSTMAHRPPSL